MAGQQQQQSEANSFSDIIAAFLAGLEQGKKQALERMRENQRFNQEMRREMDRRNVEQQRAVSGMNNGSRDGGVKPPSDLDDQAAAYAASQAGGFAPRGDAAQKGKGANEGRSTSSSSDRGVDTGGYVSGLGGDWRDDMADAVDSLVDNPHLSLDDETLQKMADMGVEDHAFASMSQDEQERFEQFDDALSPDDPYRPSHPDHEDEPDEGLDEEFQPETLASIVTTFINEDALTETERMGLVNSALQNDMLDITSMLRTDREIYDSLASMPGYEAQADAMLDGSEAEFNERRDAIVEVVELVEKHPEIRLTGETWEAIVAIDADGYMSEALGPTGRQHFDAVKRDLAAQSSVDGPDISRGVDQLEMSKALERRASMRREAARELDTITGEITPEVEAEVAPPTKLAPEFEEFLRRHGRDAQGNRMTYEPEPAVEDEPQIDDEPQF